MLHSLVNSNVSSSVPHICTDCLSKLTIEVLLDHFNFVVATVSVDVFYHPTVVIPPLEGISFRYTTANTQMPTNGSVQI
jgi:hypothetical protein